MILYVSTFTNKHITVEHRSYYSDVIMGTMASQITSITIVYSTVYPGADQRKNQSSSSLALVRGIHMGPMNSPHKWPVTRKMFPFDYIIMSCGCFAKLNYCRFLSANHYYIAFDYFSISRLTVYITTFNHYACYTHQTFKSLSTARS